MNQLPSKIALAIPPILGAFGMLLTVIGTGYETAAAHDPNVSAILGWPAGLTGVLTTVGAFLVAQANQAKAAAAVPEPPMVDGQKIDSVVHLVSLAAQQAIESEQHDVARKLIDAVNPEKPVQPKMQGATPWKNRLALLLLVAIVGCTHAVGSSIPHLSEIIEGKPAAKRSAAEPQPAPAPPSPTPHPIPLPTPQLPVLTLPDAVDGDVATFIKITAVTNGSEVRWVALDKGLNVFPGEMLKTNKATVVTASAAGNYRLLAYTAVGGVPSDPATCMVNVHGPQPPPVPPQPVPPPVPPVPPQPVPPTPPVPPVPQPTPVTAEKLWIIVVDDITARTQQTAAVLTDVRWWIQLRNAGHQWKQINITDPEAVKFKQMIDANGGIPCVVIMDATTHKWLNKDPADMRLPPTTAGLQALISKYTGK